MAYRFMIEEQSTFDEILIERGIERYNQSYGVIPPVELAAFVKDDAGKVLGGVYGEILYDWLYIDLLWVDATLHGHGYGTRLMTSIEQSALSRGIERVYLATTSFQALPFYYGLGFRIFGVMVDRPPGHRYYWLQKSITADTQRNDLLPVTDDPSPEDFRTIREGLAAHTRVSEVSADGKRLTVFMRDDDDKVVGGLISATYWGWLDIQMIWVTDDLRDQGFGRELLQLAEHEAKQRGCAYSFADVSSFQALGFFAAEGYTPFATLPHRPHNYRTYFMQKQLTPYLPRYF